MPISRSAVPGQPRRGIAPLVMAVVLALGGVFAGRGAALAAPGDGRAEPVPLGEVVQAGPWRMGVLEALTGDEATGLVGEQNGPPRDGATYVAVRLTAENTGAAPVRLDAGDFLVTGPSGFVRRFVGVEPPEPAIDAVVEPGASREGWVVLGAPTDEPALLLVYDSIALDGDWADRTFALTDGAAVPDVTTAVPSADDAGTDPAGPAPLGTAVTTDQWQVEILEVAEGIEVYNLFAPGDFRTTALGSDDAVDQAPWLALRVRITSVGTGGAPAALPTTAFMLVDGEGDTPANAIFLTPPDPDVAGLYYPGVAREGWVAFEIPEAHVATGSTVVRFLPFRTDPEPRYLDYAG